MNIKITLKNPAKCDGCPLDDGLYCQLYKTACDEGRLQRCIEENGE